MEKEQLSALLATLGNRRGVACCGKRRVLLADMKDPTFLSILMSDLRLGPKSQHQRRSREDGGTIGVIPQTDQILTHE